MNPHALNPRLSTLLWALALPWCAVACGEATPRGHADVVDPGEDAQGRPLREAAEKAKNAPPVDLLVRGFHGPLAIAHATQTDRYYVLDAVPPGGSNDAARIMRVEPDGQLVETPWVRSGKLPANACGLAVHGGDLLVAAGGAVHVLALTTGAVVRVVEVPGVAQLRWVAADADLVYAGGTLAGPDAGFAVFRSQGLDGKTSGRTSGRTQGRTRGQTRGNSGDGFVRVETWPVGEESVAAVVRSLSVFVAVAGGTVIALDAKGRQTEVVESQMPPLSGLACMGADRWFVAAAVAEAGGAGSAADQWLLQFGVCGGLTDPVAGESSPLRSPGVACLGLDLSRGRLLLGLSAAAAGDTGEPGSPADADTVGPGGAPVGSAALRILTPATER